MREVIPTIRPFAVEDLDVLAAIEDASSPNSWPRDVLAGFIGRKDSDCYVIERIPQYENSGYTRQVTWVDKAEYRFIKTDFYDRKDSLLKTLEFFGYQEYPGSFWRADRFEMINHQTGKTTTLIWSNYDFETPMDESDFNQNALKRLL